MTRKQDILKNYVVKFIGAPDTFLPGVPQGDMEQAEFEALPEELRLLALTSGLYTVEQKDGD